MAEYIDLTNLRGPAARIIEVNATTLESGSNATVDMTGPDQGRRLTFGIPRGLPGVNAVPADAAVAAYAGTDSATRAALREGFNRRDVVNVLDHGAVGDWNGSSGTDNLPAFESAITEAKSRPDVACTVVIPSGDYWLSDGWVIDADNIKVEASRDAHIRTTSPTSVGATVTFMGFGVIGDGSANQNAVTVPKRDSFEWSGGWVHATGSGVLDNALGVVRVNKAVVSDVVLEADRRALTAQYGIHNLVFERVRILRAGVTGIDLWSDVRNATVKDIHIEDCAGMAVQVAAYDQTATHRNANILLENITADTNGGAVGVNIKDSDSVTLRNVKIPGQLDSARASVSVDAGCEFASQVFGAGFVRKTPPPMALVGANGWTAYGTGYGSPVARALSDGFIQLNGAIKGGTLAAGTAILSLPVGFRSIAGHKPRFSVACIGATGGFADVYVDGSQLHLASALPSASFLALDSIRFPGA